MAVAGLAVGTVVGEATVLAIGAAAGAMGRVELRQVKRVVGAAEGEATETAVGAAVGLAVAAVVGVT